MLDLIHYNHLGVTKLKPRHGLFWPNINLEIEKYVTNCETCLNFRQSYAKEPLIPTKIPEELWSVVRTDILNFKRKYFAIIIDYYSNL